MEELIQEIKSASFWEYSSKLILIPQSSSDPAMAIRELPGYYKCLREMSNWAIYNVIFLVLRMKDCLIIYHNPFLPRESITRIRNARSTDEGFPDKISNLNGLRIVLGYIEMPPSVWIKDNRPFGTDHLLMDLFLSRINATYSYMSKVKKYKHMNQLVINSMPVFKFALKDDYVPSNQMDRVHFMVAITRADFWHKMMTRQIQWKGLCLLLFTYWCFSAAYLIAFKKRPIMWLWSVHKVIAMCLLLPSPMRLDTRRGRLLFAITFTFSFFVTTAILCIMTSNMVSYFPDHMIIIGNEIFERNISIYTNKYMNALIEFMPFENKDTVLRLVKQTEMLPWFDDDPDQKVFFIRSQVYNLFSKTASHLNEYGQDRFYLIHPEVLTYPQFYVFKPNSPYVKSFQKLVLRINEAALTRYWLTISVAHDKYPQFSYFRTQPFQPAAIPQSNQQLVLAYEELAIGLLLSFIVFLGELVYFNYARIARKFLVRIRKH